MEAIMERQGVHHPIGFGAALVHQFELLWQSRRPLVLAVGLLAVLAISGDPWNRGPMARLFTLWGVWIGPIGPIWAFAVFHGEGPSNRLYHWSQPVTRHLHTLARIAAGAAWLVVLILTLIVAGVVFALLDGDLAQFGLVGPSAWANLFTAPLIGYLAVSVLTIVSDYPIRWFLGLLFAVPLTISLLQRWVDLEGPVMRTLLKPLASETWGLFVTLIGGLGTEMAALENALDGGDRRFIAGFDPSTWWIATAFWIALWAAAAWVAASRHPDTLPRLRRSG